MPTDLTRYRLFLKHAVPTLIMSAVRRKRSAGPIPDDPRILITRIAGIGDFILLTPFLRELRRNYPSSKITLVVSTNSVQLASACPHVDRVLTIDPGPSEPIVTKPWNLIPLARYLKSLAIFADRELAGQIDIAIQAGWDSDIQWANLLTVLSGATKRIGFTEKTSPAKSWTDFGSDRLFTDVLPPGDHEHESAKYLDIIRYLGGTVESPLPEIWWRRPEDQVVADRFLAGLGDARTGNLIAFGIGAWQGRRQWPYYGELIRLLGEEFQFTPLLVAGPGEERLIDGIRESCPSAVVMQQMPLGAVASVLSRCTLFVGNDSGPMHLAAAAGIPVVEISCHPIGGDPHHPNSPGRFGPITRQKAILRPRALEDKCRNSCVEDTPHCITGISAGEVSASAISLLRSLEAPLPS